MVLPQQKWIELPLLLELERAGGQVSAGSRVYDAVAHHFPNLTSADRAQVRGSTGVNEWENNVQWARNRLRVRGDLDGGIRGVWEITGQGRTRLRQELAGLGIPSGELEAFIKSQQTIPDKVGSRWKPEQLRRLRGTKPVPPPPPSPPPPPPPDDIKARLLQRLQQIAPAQFEHLVAELMKRLGFSDVRVTGRSSDGGVDADAAIPIVGAKVCVQAKRWAPQTTVGIDPVQRLVGTVITGRYDRGIFITTSSFTSGASEVAERPDSHIVLVNGEKLVDLLVQHRLGVCEVPVVEQKIDEDFFRGLRE